MGNASILVLLQVASALQCTSRRLPAATRTASRRVALIRELLENRDEATLRRVREAILPIVDAAGTNAGPRPPRIALIGLRGAGKSTLGQMLADDLGYPFLELSREIEKFAGCSISEIQSLYGQNAYRRYERRAVEEAIQLYPEAVIAVPGGLVAEPATFNLLLAHCTTVWLQGPPGGPHEPSGCAGRPAADGGKQGGDGRPEGHPGRHRTPFYAKADDAPRHQRAAAG